MTTRSSRPRVGSLPFLLVLLLFMLLAPLARTEDAKSVRFVGEVICDVRLAPSMSKLAVVLTSGEVRVLSVPEMERKSMIELSGARSIEFLSDDDIAVGRDTGKDGEVVLVNLGQKKKISLLKTPKLLADCRGAVPSSMIYLGHANLLAIVAEFPDAMVPSGCLYLFDARSGKEMDANAYQLGTLGSIGASRDGKLLAIGGALGDVLIVDTEKHKRVQRFEASKGTIARLFILNDSKTIGALLANDSAKCFEIKSSRDVTHATPKWLADLDKSIEAINADGDWIALANKKTKELQVIRFSTGAVESKHKHGSKTIQGILFSKKLNLVVAWSGDSVICWKTGK